MTYGNLLKYAAEFDTGPWSSAEIINPSPMETSKFSYVPELGGMLNTYSARTTEGYVQSWYAKDADIPQKYWDVKENAGGGWYRYRKFTPYDHGLELKDLRWPDGELFNAQIEWDEVCKK